MSIAVSALHTYPVKSCAGIAHGAVPFGRSGLAHDRCWVLIDESGIFMTQRTVPRMALIQPRIDAGRLSLEAPGMPSIAVSPPAGDIERPPVPVRIFKADTLGQDEGPTIAEWLSAFLETPCRLLKVHPQASRPASPQHVQAWIEKNQDWMPDFPAVHSFGFADGFPFLVANEASLKSLNEELLRKGASEVPMNRFRPNIVIRGLPAFEEDHLAGLEIGGVLFAFVKPCGRCPIPNIDQKTAVKGEEPGRTLAEIRSFPQGVLFGGYTVTNVSGLGRLQVGDAVTPQYAF